MLSSQLKTGLYFFSLNETSFIYFFLSTISHYRFIRIRSYNNSCLFIDLYTINIMIQHIFSNRITCQTKHINIPSAIRHVDFLHLLRNFLKSFSYRHSIPLHLYSKKKTKYNYIHRQNTCVRFLVSGKSIYAIPSCIATEVHATRENCENI